jgi:hypothetical protein
VSEKITRFPSSGWSRAANRRGKWSVSCTTTDRFLVFGKEVGPAPEGHVVKVDVMTDGNGEARRLCTLTLTLEQLAKVIGQYGEIDGSHSDR